MPKSRFLSVGLLLALSSLVDAFEIVQVQRDADTVRLHFVYENDDSPSFVVEHSDRLESASWTMASASISTPNDGLHMAELEADERLSGFFRIRAVPGGSSTVKVVINEIMANNETAFADGDGDFPDWVELYNPESTPADLSGYGLTDNENRLGKWLFPEGTVIEPEGFLIVFASGKEDDEIPSGEWHASFGLSNGREPVILTAPDGDILDRLDPATMASDTSMGRSRSDLDILYVFEPNQATPGKKNHGFIFGAPDPFIQTPRFSVPGGVYESTVTVNLVAPREGDVIRYTTDGSEPFHSLFSSNSTLYEEPIVIDQSTVIRAKVMGSDSSRTVTSTYLIGVQHELPILSMAADPENFDFRDGYLYGFGDHMFSGDQIRGTFPYSSSNAWDRNREIEAGLEFFEPDGDDGFAMNVGVKIFGGWGSRGYPQKSMALFARQAYGYGRIRYQLFPDKDVDSFESIVLRNSGNDNQSTWLTHPRPPINAFSDPASHGSYFVNCNFTLFRDALVQSLAQETGLDTQGYRPAVLYLNGDYWGIYNIREKLTEHYVESHHDVPSEEVDLIEGYGAANAGSATVYNRMRSYVSGNDMNDPEKYQFVQDNYLDIENFIDYHLTVIWGQNFDIGNIKCWRAQSDEGGQFRWLVYDQDYGFNLWKPEVYLPAMKRDYADYENMFTFHTNASGTGTGWPNAGGRTLLLREMLESETFQRQFILRCADLLNHLWSTERVLARIDAMAGVIRSEMPRHLQRWSWEGIQARGFGHPHKEEDAPLDLEHWERNVEVMRAFARKRPGELREHLMSHFGFEKGLTNVGITISGSDKGTVRINTMNVPAAEWAGTYFRDVPISLEAIPNEGSTFVGWEGALSGAERTALLDLEAESIAVTARFE